MRLAYCLPKTGSAADMPLLKGVATAAMAKFMDKDDATCAGKRKSFAARLTLGSPISFMFR
jgi:hypothetical protein